MCDECETISWLSPARFSRRDALKFAAAVAASAGAVAAGAGAPGAAGVASAAPLAPRPRPVARRAMVGASVLTMTDGRPAAEAILIEGDRIVEVGSDAAVLRSLRRRGGGEVTRMNGRTVVPGFIDPHGHFLLEGMYGALTVDLSSPPLGRMRSITQVLDRLRADVGTPKPFPGFFWTIGTLFDDTAVREKRFPTMAELDRVSRRDPIMVVHNSIHVATVNSAGLRALGLSRSTPNPHDGEYGRRADGSLDGMLYESVVEKAMTSALPSLAGEGLLNVVGDAMERSLRNGVSTALDASVSPILKIAYSALAATPFLACRMGLWLSAASNADLRAALADQPNAAPWVETIGVKGFADGSIQGWTAALREPYHTLPSGGAPQGPRGKLRTSVPKLTELMVMAAENGLPSAIHANGDAAVDAVIAATKAARAATSRRVRVMMQHCQVVHPEQIVEMKRLGITASVFSRHIAVWGDRHRDVFLGPERAAAMGPSRSFIDGGISLTLHTDTPVTPLEPLTAMRDAVERRTGSGAVLGPAERITPREALAAYTSEAAAQLGFADRGRIAPGLLADLTVLGDDPLTTPLDKVRVHQTWVGGHRAWSRNGA
ncbi:amidohydrolase [Gordonia shandongensis]|uniref:amidohydrolase n=1 Tax=Gordonia shandongensis TaxID=376351 RepID=UPI00047B2C39|nr:amidohydrolase [Gordonia shandongensis]